MISSLTEARLSLAASAMQNLQKLVGRLEKLVSTVPDYSLGKQIEKEKSKEEEESEEEDPTELFHRDVGIQTSPPRSPTLTPSAEPSTLETQTSRLTGLSQSLKSLITSSNSEGENTTELETTIGYVKEVLEGMTYVQPTTYGYGGFNSGMEAKEEDEIARVKAGIRGVKGVLLSAKSFPGGVRGVR
jgi:hypothetical protein